MAGNDVFTATGLTGAETIAKELAVFAKAGVVAELFNNESRQPYPGRKSTPSNEQIIEYLAEGGRDITPNKEDSQDIAEGIANEMVKQLRRAGTVIDTVGRDGARRQTTLTAERQARRALTKGFRDALDKVQGIMRRHIESMTTSDGGPADRVSQDDGGKYARWRNNQFGVNEGVVYVASGQFHNAIKTARKNINIKNVDLGRLAQQFIG